MLDLTCKDESEIILDKLITILSQKTGLNLFNYRRDFIRKKIKSRMIRLNLKKFTSYLKHLNIGNNELEFFLKKFNVNYTLFFRNLNSFQVFQNYFFTSLNLGNRRIKGDLNSGASDEFENTIKAKISEFSNGVDIVKKNRDEALSFLKDLSKQRHQEQRKDVDLKETSIFQKISNPRRIKPPINVWSCGCSTGEEPYTLAMILKNLKQQINHFPCFKIIASDIDAIALNKATKGMFSDYSMTNTPFHYKKEFFVKKKVGFRYSNQICEKIRKEIKFINEDITNAHKYNWKYDIVFLKNVLIYLKRELRSQILNNIGNCIANGGLLFLGESESIHSSDHGFKIFDLANKVYIKQKVET